MTRYHSHRRRCGGGHGHGHGPIRRTVRGLAQRFGVPRGFVIVAFVMLFIMSAPLAIAAFIGAWYWVKHPGRVESAVDRLMESTRRAFGERPSRYAGAGAGGVDEDIDFAELRAKFADLEARAGRMEEHVAADEYTLRKQFDDLGRR